MATPEAYLRRGEQLRRLMTERLLAGAGVEGVVEILHQATGRPVLIHSQAEGNWAAAPAGFRPPVRPDPAQWDGLPARTHPIRAGNELLGHLIFWGQEPVDFLAVEHGATVAALALRQRRELVELRRRFQDDLLAALLAGGQGAMTSLHARAPASTPCCPAT